MAGKIITNLNGFINGNTLIGKMKKVKLPAVKQTMVKAENLGIYGSPQYPGGINELECTITWASIYEDVAQIVGNPFNMINFQFRGSIEDWGPSGRTEETPLVILVNGHSEENQIGEFSKKEASTQETKLSCEYVKVTIGGKEIVEIDVHANIWKAGGVDLLSNWRANLGA